jgi:hypothetical protein
LSGKDENNKIKTKTKTKNKEVMHGGKREDVRRESSREVP